MHTAATRINCYIASLSKALRTPLKLKNGLIALYDDKNQESLVIEVPKGSDIVIFHCKILNLQSDTNVTHYQRLLKLNFDIADMKGAWLAQDENTIRLCHMVHTDLVGDTAFCRLCFGFIDQARRLKSKLAEKQFAVNAARTNRPKTFPPRPL